MADESGLKPVMYADFVRFLKAMNPNYACHFCGGARFSISTDEGGEDEVDLTSPRILSAPGTNIPMAMTFCSQCGAVRYHSYDIVSEWIDDNPEGEEVDDKGAESKEDSAETTEVETTDTGKEE